MSESQQYLIAIFIIFSLLLVIFLIWILNKNGKKIRKTKKPKNNDVNSNTNLYEIKIQEQPDNTIQIVNNTSEKYLHVFCQNSLPSDVWEKAGGSDTALIHTPIDWGRKKQMVRRIMHGTHWELSMQLR